MLGCLLLLYLSKPPAIETTEILMVIDISELVADNTGVADCCIYVGMRVPENPRINTAVSDEVA